MIPGTVGRLPLRQITRLTRNPKEHDVGAIIDSLQRFGYVELITINVRTEHLVHGHGRDEGLSQMRDQGMDPPKNVYVTPDDWEIDVYFIDIPEDQEIPLTIALNRTSELGGWNMPMLAEELAKIAKGGEQAIKGIGYDAEAINDLIQMLTPPNLDSLAETYGDPDPKDFWPILKIQVHPETFERWVELCKIIPGDDEAVKIKLILESVDEEVLNGS